MANFLEFARFTDDLAALAGTIVHVADLSPNETGVSFSGAGLTSFATENSGGLPAWIFNGALSSQELMPGDTLEVQGRLKIVSPAVEEAGAMRTNITLILERLSGPDGFGGLARNTYASIFLTPTGLPIERPCPSYHFKGLIRGFSVDMTKLEPDKAEAVLDLDLPIPVDLPAGFYRPFINLGFEGVPVESLSVNSSTVIDGAGRDSETGMYLPIVQLGSPDSPRFYWTLLMDTLSNGTRGVRAIEDRNRFGVASRILTQSETFIVPRLDPTSAKPFTYRLEPLAPTVSLEDRGRPSNPPLIPFRFPSGSLTVRVRKPDGSIDILGPTPFVQSRLKGPVDREGRVG